MCIEGRFHGISSAPGVDERAHVLADDGRVVRAEGCHGLAIGVGCARSPCAGHESLECVTSAAAPEREPPRLDSVDPSIEEGIETGIVQGRDEDPPFPWTV
jgi:hypothetical protein